MLGRNSYTPEEIAGGKAAVKAQLAAYKKVAGAGDAGFEARYFNNMVMVLDRWYVHRVRPVTGKDNNPLNEVELLVDSLRDHGFLASFVAHDVGSEANWDAAVAHTVESHGRLDVLVNNAGVGGRIGQPFDDIPFDEWRRVVAINLEGAFLGTRAGVRTMKQSGGGSIVNVGSIAGLIGTRGGAAYGASKGGVHALTRQAAYSCGKHKYNIRVNAMAGQNKSQAIQSLGD